MRLVLLQMAHITSREKEGNRRMIFGTYGAACLVSAIDCAGGYLRLGLGLPRLSIAHYPQYGLLMPTFLQAAVEEQVALVAMCSNAR